MRVAVSRSPSSISLVTAYKIRLIVAEIVHDPAIADLDDRCRHPFQEVPVVAGEDDGPLVGQQGFGERVDRFDVKVVAGLVEDQDVVLAQHQPGEAEPRPLTAGEHRDFLPGVRAAKKE